MTVPAYTRPNFTEQSGSAYKGNLDGAAQLAERVSLAFLPQAQASPDMTVRVLAGALLIDGTLTEVAAQNTGTITAPVSNPRIDRVVIDVATGAVSIVAGTEHASPTAPAIPAGKLPVCRVALATSTAQITASLLTDERARPTGTAALHNVGTGPNDVPSNSLLTTGTGTIVAGETWTAPVAIYLDYANTRGGGVDRWYKIDTDATGPVRISKRVAIALANAASAGDSVLAQLRPGRVSGFTSLTSGLPVWASTTAGALSQSDPSDPATGTQAISRVLGYAASATEIDFDPEQDTSYFGFVSSMAVDATFTIEHYPDPGAVDRHLNAYLVGVTTEAALTGGTATAPVFTFASGSAANLTDNNTGTTADSGTLGDLTAASQANRRVFVVDYGSNRTLTKIELVLGSRAAGSGNSNFGLFHSTDGSTWTQAGTNFALTGSAATQTISVSATARYVALIANAENHASSGVRAAELRGYAMSGARSEKLVMGSATIDAAATDRVTSRFDDGAGANASTKSTFRNRMGATRDIAFEVVL